LGVSPDSQPAWKWSHGSKLLVVWKPTMRDGPTLSIPFPRGGLSPPPDSWRRHPADSPSAPQRRRAPAHPLHVRFTTPPLRCSSSPSRRRVALPPRPLHLVVALLCVVQPPTSLPPPRLLHLVAALLLVVQPSTSSPPPPRHRPLPPRHHLGQGPSTTVLLSLW
jgi:hypothetical protein